MRVTVVMNRKSDRAYRNTGHKADRSCTKLQVSKAQLCLLVRFNGPRRSMRRLNEIEDNAL
jgi:hypothetical protein